MASFNTPNSLISRRYTDIDLAFKRHPITKDIVKLTDEAAIAQAVKNAVLTKHYESPFHPEKGSNITALLFENISVITSLLIKDAVIEVLQNFEKRIKVLQVEVKVDPEGNSYNCTIVYTIKNSLNPLVLNIILHRDR